MERARKSVISVRIRAMRKSMVDWSYAKCDIGSKSSRYPDLFLIPAVIFTLRGRRDTSQKVSDPFRIWGTSTLSPDGSRLPSLPQSNQRGQSKYQLGLQSGASVQNWV